MLLNLSRTKTSTLFTVGLAAMAVRGVLQLVLNHTGHSNNIIDFALGLIFGLGAGLLLLVAWRRGRESNGASSK